MECVAAGRKCDFQVSEARSPFVQSFYPQSASDRRGACISLTTGENSMRRALFVLLAAMLAAGVASAALDAAAQHAEAVLR
jgi:hypothetical protein